MSLCMGIALLGLCLPVPGMTRNDLAATGWPSPTADRVYIAGTAADDLVWHSSVKVSAGVRKLYVDIVGSGTRIGMVTIMVKSGRSRSAHRAYELVTLALGSACNVAHSGRFSCEIAGHAFFAYPCVGTWILSLEDKSVEQLQSECEMVELFGRP